jgi:hypothetical protein
MEGFFELKTPKDLLKKLQSDYERFNANELDTYAAFDFFVTAEHLLDWVYPGKANETQRKHSRQNEILLGVCSHIASGAKHFKVEAKHHESVSDTERQGSGGAMFGGSPLGAAYFGEGPTVTLVVELDGRSATELGQTILAFDLATKILNFWETHPALM